MSEERISDTEINARIAMLLNQRDEALSRCVLLAGKLAVCEQEKARLAAELEAMKERHGEDPPPPEKQANPGVQQIRQEKAA